MTASDAPVGEREACPTCGGTGPDSFSYLPDEGVLEAACGDEWHPHPCNPDYAHDGPCGAEGCWWTVLFGSHVHPRDGERGDE